jgi:ankyrin repeat protein
MKIATTSDLYITPLRNTCSGTGQHGCLARISRSPAIAPLTCPLKSYLMAQRETLALLRYAAVYWGPHMNVLTEADFASEKGGELEKEALIFLSDVKCLHAASQALILSHYPHIPGDDGKLVYFHREPQESALFLQSHWIGRYGLALLFRQCDSRGAAWDARDNDGRTPLSWAAGQGHEAIVKLLLETGKIDANYWDVYRRSPVSWACENGHEAIVKLLLDRKVDFNLQSRTPHLYHILDRTPLAYAAMNGHEAVVRLLLGTGMVDVDISDNCGITPLHSAVSTQNETIVRLLLATDQVDVEHVDNAGYTPLSRAVLEGYLGMVKLLLAHDAKVDIEAKSGREQTLLALACEGGHEEVIKLLLDTGKANVNSKDAWGRTPLISLALRDVEQAAAVRLLLDTGEVDVNSCAYNGRPPLNYATEKRHEVVMKLLLDAGAIAGLVGSGGVWDLEGLIAEGPGKEKKTIPILTSRGRPGAGKFWESRPGLGLVPVRSHQSSHQVRRC